MGAVKVQNNPTLLKTPPVESCRCKVSCLGGGETPPLGAFQSRIGSCWPGVELEVLGPAVQGLYLAGGGAQCAPCAALESTDKKEASSRSVVTILRSASASDPL